MEVIAHRGASAYAPEHGFAAYDLALEQGADALELDVRATADGTLVVLHDPTLRRTHGDPRRIDRVRLRDLDPLRRPLTLDAVLARYGDRTRWLLELKVPVGADLARTVRRHGLGHLVVVQAFDAAALAPVTGLPVAPLCEDATTAWTYVARPGGAAGLGVRHTALDPMLVRAAHGRGLTVRAWTANTVAAIDRLAAMGTDGVITDAPDLAVRTAAAA